MTHPISQEVQSLAEGLTEAQRSLVAHPVAGVIAGQFCCSPTPAILDELHAFGICGQRFEPSDYATRGYAHAARLITRGLAVAHLLRIDQ